VARTEYYDDPNASKPNMVVAASASSPTTTGGSSSSAAATTTYVHCPEAHSLIPSGGQRYRTTGVLHADGVGGGIDLSAVGARSNLTLIQRADSLGAGEFAILMSNGAHA